MSSRNQSKKTLAKELADALSAVRQVKANASALPRRRPPSRQVRKARNGRNGGVTLQGTVSDPFRRSAEPVSVNYQTRNTQFTRILKALAHKDFGEGVRVHGRQLLCTATTTASDSQLFTSSGLATVTINSVNLSPDGLNGRLALIARTYSRYAFRTVKIHYVPRVATTAEGGFALGYVQDGVATSFATESYLQTVQMEPSITTPFRKEMTLDITYGGSQVWFTESDSATLAGARQTEQGQLIGFPDASSIGATQQGWFWIEYVIDLYQPSMDLGFTVDVKSADEKAIANAAVARHRAAKGDIELPTQEIVEISGEKFVKVA